MQPERNTEQSKERRVGPRFDADFDVAYVAGRTFITGRALQISAEGISFTTHSRPKVGSEIDIRFRLRGDKKPVSAVGKVRSSSPDRVGVEFVKIPIEDRLRILQQYSK